MFSKIHKNSNRKKNELLCNVNKLYENIYSCRNMVLVALGIQNLTTIQSKNLEDLNWNLFLLEQSNCTQRDKLKYLTDFNPTQHQVYYDKYEANSEAYDVIKSKIKKENCLFKASCETGDSWFDWSFAESETSDELSMGQCVSSCHRP